MRQIVLSREKVPVNLYLKLSISESGNASELPWMCSPQG